jgi:hypothetical protein
MREMWPSGKLAFRWAITCRAHLPVFGHGED